MTLKEAFCFGNTQLVNGEWVPLKGLIVGEAGKTDRVNGGVMVTQYSKLIEIDEDRLYNEANGDVLHRTRKDKERGKFQHYFSKDTGVLANVYLRKLAEEE